MGSFPDDMQSLFPALATAAESDEISRMERAFPNRIVTARETEEMQRREQTYREGRSAPELRDRIAILVDDGLATGATMRAAVKALRQRGAAKIVVAVPVGPPDTCHEIEEQTDETICLSTPEFFQAVGQYYEDFSQTTDEDVRELLTSAARDMPEGNRKE